MNGFGELLPRLGFACNWDEDPSTTWSGTPWNLFRALGSYADVRDVGVHLSPATRAALKAIHIRRAAGRWVTTWKHGRLTENLVGRLVETKLRSHGIGAVVQIGDIGEPGVPFYVIEDLSFEILLSQWRAGDGVLHFPGLSLRVLERLRDRQRRIHDRAAGLIALSRWFASTLVESGLSASKVHVMYPGATAIAGISRRAPQRLAPRRRLLFIGKDFLTKGGDLVLEALPIIRREVPGVRLTVAGPASWPLAEGLPEGVDFLGRVPLAEIGNLMDGHDLFVMPSRFEGFGIVFVEALAQGLPCIARDAFAMPELIRPGRNGALIHEDNPNELAAAVIRVLGDDSIYEATARGARAVADYFTWDRAALDVLAAIRGEPGPPRWTPGDSMAP